MTNKQLQEILMQYPDDIEVKYIYDCCYIQDFDQREIGIPTQDVIKQNWPKHEGETFLIIAST